MTARARIALGAALLLGAVVALVATAWVLVERPAGEARTARSADRVLAFEPAQVRELSIAGPAAALGSGAATPSPGGSGEIRLVRAGSGWGVAGPIEAPADAGAVDALLEALAGLRRRAALDVPGGGLAQLGLDPPRRRVAVVLAGGGTLALELGDDHPFDRAVHARVGGTGGRDAGGMGAPFLLAPGSRATLAPPLELLLDRPAPGDAGGPSPVSPGAGSGGSAGEARGGG